MEDTHTMTMVKTALLGMQRYPWEQGVASHAFIDADDTAMAIAMAHEAAYRQISDGRLAIIGEPGSVTDPCSPGEAIAYAYQKTGDPFFKTALQRVKTWALKNAPRSEEGIVYHVIDRPVVWSDSTYMLPPFLAYIGEYDEAFHQMVGYFGLLHAPEKNMLCHRYHVGEGRFERADCWGGGNGWALAGIARMLRFFPVERTSQRATLVGLMKNLLDACLKHMRGDGLFYDVLDDPTTFVETNFAQMCAYAIYTGVADGWLDRSYLPAANRMRAAANAKIDEYGLVQGACGAPDFSHSGVSAEAQAFYLLMEYAAARV